MGRVYTGGGDVGSDGRLPTASQTKQGQALGRSQCTCNADPSPYNPTPGLAGEAPGPPSPPLRIGLGARCRRPSPAPAEPPCRYRQVSGAGLDHTSGPASPAGAAVAVLQAAPPLGAILGAGGCGGRRPMGGAAGGAGSWLRPCPGRAAEGGQWAPPAERISPAPTRALAAVHAGSGGPGRREGLAALTRRADEAPARRRRRRRRVCVCREGRGKPIDTHFAGTG
ncbi:hypothetical protein R6Z07M_015048 [Ovis aries]